jgi:hypothetical protein
VAAAVGLWLAYPTIRDVGARLGWRAVVLAGILAEIVFLALFFAAMFLSSGPAMFVALVLGAVFALGLAAQVSPRGSS